MIVGGMCGGLWISADQHRVAAPSPEPDGYCARNAGHYSRLAACASNACVSSAPEHVPAGDVVVVRDHERVLGLEQAVLRRPDVAVQLLVLHQVVGVVAGVAGAHADLVQPVEVRRPIGANHAGLSSVRAMDFALSEELLALQESVRRLAQDKVKPRAREIDETGEYPQDIFEVFRDAGLLGLCIPEEYGGCGAGILGLTIAMEEVAKYSNTARADAAADPPADGPDHDRRHRGAEAEVPAGHRRRRERCGFGLSEPQAGSDVMGMRTKAVKDGDDWILNGTKCWMSGVVQADWYIVFAKTKEATSRDHDSITVVHRRPQHARPRRSAPPTARWACAASTPASCCSTTCGCRPRT